MLYSVKCYSIYYDWSCIWFLIMISNFHCNFFICNWPSPVLNMIQISVLNGKVERNECWGDAQCSGRPSPSGELGLNVRWSYLPLPPAELQHHLPLLPNPIAPKTRAFISQAKYPRSPQSLSLLALRQSDNYLVPFPLLLASREVFWLALLCMKYYQNIAHFYILQPLTQEIWSHSSRDWQVSVFHLPLRIAALFRSYSAGFDGKRSETV